MSIEDLELFLEKLETKPAPITEPTSVGELVGQRDDVAAIVAQRDIEERFNNEIDFEPVEIIDPDEPPVLDGEFSGLGISTIPGDVKVAGEKLMFALSYSGRLIRSALALSGTTARAERFGDVRKSQGFWVAMADTMSTMPGIAPRQAQGQPDTSQRTSELAGQVPALLTDPTAPESTLPGVGGLITAPFPELEPAEWVFDLVGELVIEANVLKATKTLAKKGISKLTKGAYGAGEEIVKKRGVARLLGQLDDDELRAIDEAVAFRKSGTLGTKPPQADIDGAMQRTFDYIDQSKPSRLTKKEVISAKRKQAAAKMYATRGDNYGPGYSARMTKAGATSSTEKSFTPLLEVSAKAQDDLVTLQKVIDNHDFGGSKIYTTSNTQRAIARLYEYGELLTPGEIENLRDVFGSDFANSLTKFVAKPTGIAGKTFEVASKTLKGLNRTSRALMTTGELSFLMRQGNYRAWSRPEDAIRSFSVAMRSLISPQYADNIDDALRFSKRGKQGLEHDLFLGKWRDIKRPTQKEEAFMAEWLDKVPGIGRIKREFERGYVNGLNQIRVDWFDEGMQIIENSGRASDDKLISKWADYINNMTGRPDFDNIADANKALKGMVEVAEDVLFAPRFAASKWNRHKVAAEIMFGAETPNAMRQILATDAIVKWRRYERLAHWATQNGFEVETNPQSSDYLKIKEQGGPTRFDVLGGDTQILVMMARLVSGQTKDIHTKLLKDNIATEIATQHLSGKLNPLWSLIIDANYGRDFEGRNIDDPVVLAKVIGSKFLPLYSMDIADKMFNSYEEQGKTGFDLVENALGVAAAGFVGAGIQTFEPSPRKEYELMVNDKAIEIYGKNFDELSLWLKKEVMFEAENDDIDKTELLKEEMGMVRQTRATASRLNRFREKSFFKIRSSLGKQYSLFDESNIRIDPFPVTIEEVRLSTEQHDRLTKSYIALIKQELKSFPDMANLPPLDYDRRQWLQDAVDFARREAVFLLRNEE